MQLARGPVDHVISLGYGATDTANLGVIVRFEIPQKVPFGTTISLADLASATRLDLGIRTRTIRYAVTNDRIYSGLCHAGQNKNLNDMTFFNCSFSTRIVICLADALKTQQEKAENAPTAAFNVAYSGYQDLFDFMGKNPGQSQEYFNYLDGRSQLPRYAVGNVVHAWDWASVGSGTVVDVVGSSGHTSIALARAYPDLNFVVQDINPSGLGLGRAAIAGNADLKSRISFQQHDFFLPQPVEAADVYFFRHVLHDWPDGDFVRIVQALVPALRDGAKVILSEGVMPKPPAARSALLEDKHVRMDDLVMLAAHVARERSVEQYTKLFEAASPGFYLVGEYGHEVGVHHSLVVFEYKLNAILHEPIGNRIS